MILRLVCSHVCYERSQLARRSCRSYLKLLAPFLYTTSQGCHYFSQAQHHTHEPMAVLDESSLSARLDPAIYEWRRQCLMQSLRPNSVAIVPGYGLRYMSPGIFYPFRQAKDFLYLSGFDEPNAAMMIRKTTDNAPIETTLFVQPRDRQKEIWDGFRYGVEGAIDVFGAQKAYPISEISTHVNHLLSDNIHTVYTDLPITASGQDSILRDTHLKLSDTHSTEKGESDSSWFSLPKTWNLSTKPKGSIRVQKLAPHIHRLRHIKSREEVSIMRKAGAISGRAFVEAMKKTKPGVSEHQIYAILDYESRMRGADCLAYVPVVAGGKNGLVLHYVKNDQLLRDGDLLLVDAGCDVQGYASDISRVWPVSGKFTEPQKQVYEAVLRVQKRIIKRCSEDARVSLNELQSETFGALKEECESLFGRKVSHSEMHRLYPHHVGHWLGMDVHDTESISRSETLREGMVVTVEPGLYIPDHESYPEKYRGIAIRIEDDIAIGGPSSNGQPIVLTSEAPKEIDDIEAVMASIVG